MDNLFIINYIKLVSKNLMKLPLIQGGTHVSIRRTTDKD
jgi:hypothetical protein